MSQSNEASPGWERGVLERLARSSLDEQRRARRWNIFFRLLGFAFVFLLLFWLLGWIGIQEVPLAGRHTAVVDVRGVIAEDRPAGADLVVQGLHRAFDGAGTAGVIVRINSPGGSPVQAGYIHDEIVRLKKLHPDVPVYAVVEDTCASGGYYVAVAADKIFVSPASMVGSIGVLINGFGFTEAMHKLGVQRRLITAGKNKGFLDPFSPLAPAQRAHAEKMVEEIHQQFIGVVKAGRGDRLKQTPELFSGLIWTGERSVELGLADGVGSAGSVARDVIKAEKVVNYTLQPNLARQLAQRLGAAMSAAVEEALAPQVR